MLAASGMVADGWITPAVAQEHMSLLRDAEIENALRAYATPIFTAAGLDASFVRIYIVNDPRINSFVAGGQNVFVNSGLILRADTANEVVGVIAHETGHIAGGHIIRSAEAQRNAMIQSLLGMALGAGAMAGGAGGAGAGALAGSSSLAQRYLSSYSIGQEERADAAAMSFLDRSHQSARGLLSLFRTLEKEELLTPARQDPYLQTHPLSRERLEAVQGHVEASPWSSAQEPVAFTRMHERIRAKLTGFLSPPEKVLTTYSANDRSITARYARAIALYRIPDLSRAMLAIDDLLHDYPNDPYFLELKGQALFENQRGREALPFYEAAVRALPDSALLKMELAQVQLEVGDPALNAKAMVNLRQTTVAEPDNNQAWRLLATAYGREGNIGLASLSLAEEASAGGHKKEAGQQASRAMQILPRGSPGWLRAEDIRQASRQADD